MKTRYLTNYPQFKEVLGKNYKTAIKNFKEAKSCEENENIIVSSYDEEGFCTFEFVSSDKFIEYWEFTGTAK